LDGWVGLMDCLSWELGVSVYITFTWRYFTPEGPASPRGWRIFLVTKGLATPAGAGPGAVPERLQLDAPNRVGNLTGPCSGYVFWGRTGWACNGCPDDIHPRLRLFPPSWSSHIPTAAHESPLPCFFPARSRHRCERIPATRDAASDSRSD
jgi:hypothetical protein